MKGIGARLEAGWKSLARAGASEEVEDEGGESRRDCEWACACCARRSETVVMMRGWALCAGEAAQGRNDGRGESGGEEVEEEESLYVCDSADWTRS